MNPADMLYRPLKVGTRVRVKVGTRKGDVGEIVEVLTKPGTDESVSSRARYGVKLSTPAAHGGFSTWDYIRSEIGIIRGKSK